MTSKRTLIRGGHVYDHEGDVHKPALADILIEDDKIHSVGTDLAPEGAHEVIDASGRLVVPGLINAHYHSHDVLCRGLFEELPLEMWLLYTLPMGADRSKDEVRARTLVGALESLRCGITTVQDMLGLSPLDMLRRIQVPQAFRLTLPSLVNEMVLLIKASSLISVVGVAEITRTAQNIAASTYRPLEAYVAAGLIYFLICGVLSLVAHAAEYRLQHA